MMLNRFRLSALAALAAIGLTAGFALPAMAQLPGLGAPSLPPGATEAATDAVVDAVKSRAGKPAPRKVAAKKTRTRGAKKTRAARGEPALRGGAIVVTNRRGANLLELTATPTNGGESVVIARDVAPGARATGKLPAKVGCVFSLSGTFDDESSMQAANMNLCKDGRINLVE